MAAYKLSPLAESDIDKIFEYGILTFGLGPAQDYLLGLHDRFQLLADQTDIGRSAEEFAPQLRRFEYGSDVVFYTSANEMVLVVRVLHQSRDFRRHF